MIFAAHANGGLALLAKIALALKSAYEFSKKKFLTTSEPETNQNAKGVHVTHAIKQFMD